MKLKFIGKKVNWEGKTLWEICGNLKNFGVGRFIRKWESKAYPEPSFFKIVKVQPVPPPKNQFDDRGMIVWTEEVFRAVSYPLKVMKSNTHLPKYELIPKSEEEKYLRAAKECAKNFKLKEIPKYCNCPPLYKILWERQHLKETKTYKPMPNINNVLHPMSLYKVKLSEEAKTCSPSSTSLYQTNVPVENMIKEIVKLKKVIRDHSLKSGL